jgi:trimeric autotransporter adhesin
MGKKKKLGLLCLEKREVPAVFTVNTTGDNGDNTSPLTGSLRAAIVNANSTAGADTIQFNIPGAGVQTITPTTVLPFITEQVTIDGTTQAGFSGTPLIEVNGKSVVAGSGFFLLSNQGSIIRGLTINNFSAINSAAIRISGGSNNIIAGNLIGTNSSGTSASANTIGVQISGSSGNTVGGTSEADRNIISGNLNTGVRVDSDGSSGNSVIGNFIGTSLNGSVAVPNGGEGIILGTGATNNKIGGTISGSGNIVAGNKASGILIFSATTAGNIIQGNRVGLGLNGLPLANGADGIRAVTAAGSSPAGGLSATNANLITGNTVSGNTGNGINVLDTSRGVRIEQNSIVNNVQLGIAVAPTANGGLLAPTITKVSSESGQLTVSGTLLGPPSTQIRVEIYGNSAADGSGFGEGQNFLGFVNVNTDGSGNATFSKTVAKTVAVSTTAQVTSTGDTSAFSNTFSEFTSPSDPIFNNRFAVGQGDGNSVKVYDQFGDLKYSLTPFDSTFTGGVRVAMGDVNGDGALDVITGTGPGIATQVKIYDGKTQQLLQTIDAFEASFKGGVYVASGDVNGDGKAEIVFTPDEGGGPRVRVFQLGSTAAFADFFGIEDPNFRGGARASLGDINNDKTDDLVVSAGFLGGPRVAAFNGTTVRGGSATRLFGDFFAFEQTLRNGAFVSVADVNGDGFGELIAGGGPGGGPRVIAFSGKDLVQSAGKQTFIANFFAGNTNNRGGIRIASRLITGDTLGDIVTGDGTAGGGVVQLYAGASLNAQNFTPLVSITPFGNSSAGVFVG